MLWHNLQFTFVSWKLVALPLMLVFATGTPETLTVATSWVVVRFVAGGKVVSVRAETQPSPLNVPMYGECLIPNA